MHTHTTFSIHKFFYILECLRFQLKFGLFITRAQFFSICFFQSCNKFIGYKMSIKWLTIVFSMSFESSWGFYLAHFQMFNYQFAILNPISTGENSQTHTHTHTHAQTYRKRVKQIQHLFFFSFLRILAAICLYVSADIIYHCFPLTRFRMCYSSTRHRTVYENSFFPWLNCNFFRLSFYFASLALFLSIYSTCIIFQHLFCSVPSHQFAYSLFSILDSLDE